MTRSSLQVRLLIPRGTMEQFTAPLPAENEPHANYWIAFHKHCYPPNASRRRSTDHLISRYDAFCRAMIQSFCKHGSAMHMAARRLTIFILLITALVVPAITQQEKVDLEMVTRIRYEGFRNSKIMDLAS